jgi:hypothetical protein
MLYHVSEQPGIERFEPRLAPGLDHPAVWAVHANRLRNYLLPRDCPRVTFFADANTTPQDKERFLGASPAVIAIESAWLQRIRQARLYCYVLPQDSFHLVDEGAGYYRSLHPVTPQRVEIIDDLLNALIAQTVELRILPNLWALSDAVAASTLGYSIIRMRNASPHPEAASSGAKSLL